MRSMLKKMNQISILPFVFVCFPIFDLFLHNVGRMAFQSTLTSFTICLLFSSLIYIVFSLILRNNVSSAIITSLFMFGFMNFGEYVVFISKKFPNFQRTQLISIIVFSVFFLGVTLFINKVKPNNKKIIQFTNFYAILLIIVLGVKNVSSIKFLFTDHQSQFSSVQDIIRRGTPTNIKADIDYKPDIYFIILDAYARNDVLSEFYGYDNSEFSEFLEGNGFFISPNSQSNFAETRLSLPSTLSMEYGTYLARDTSTTRAMFQELQKYWQNNLAFIEAKELGYTTVNFRTLSAYGENTKADVIYDHVLFSDFDILLLQKTMLQSFATDFSIINQQQQVINSLNEVSEVAENPKPTFTFVHILSPHIPYVFDESGSFPSFPQARNNVLNTSWMPNEAYIDQLAYTNTLVEDAVEQILLNSSEPPIIIISGDHAGEYERQEPEEKMAIFFAIFAPGLDKQSLEAGFNDFTLVNLFRILFDSYFDTEFGVLENISEFSLYSSDYQFCTFENENRFQNEINYLQENQNKINLGEISECDLYHFTPGKDGLYGGEKNFRWAKSSVNIQFPVVEAAPYLLTVDIANILIGTQTFRVYVNDNLLEEYQIDNLQKPKIRVIIPASEINQGENARIRFESSYSRLAGENDARIISLMYKQISWEPLSDVDIDNESDINKSENIMLGNGWYPLEGANTDISFRWVDNNAEFYILKGDYSKMEVVPLSGPGLLYEPFSLYLVDASGKQIGEQQVNNDFLPIVFDLPDCQTEICKYSFSVQNGGQDFAPNDQRILNFRIISMRMIP